AFPTRWSRWARRRRRRSRPARPRSRSSAASTGTASRSPGLRGSTGPSRAARRARPARSSARRSPWAGHPRTAPASRLPGGGLHVVGAYLRPVESPFAPSRGAYRLPRAGLTELRREAAPDRVTPGHGPPLSAEEALGVAEADLGYLRSLHRAVVDALSQGGT